MAFTIQVHYQTGDSEHTYATEHDLGIEWATLDAAKAALARLREHYVWYRYQRDNWDYQRSELLKRFPNADKEPEWHVGLEYDWTVKLVLDNGKEAQFAAFWCGNFEALYSMKIVETKDDSLEFVWGTP